jgi:HEPN domain-containing protein
VSPIEEDIQPWLRHAESDMVSAEMLRQGGEFLNALFHLQQATEKTLKALFIKQNSAMPPRLHDLHRLADQCGLGLSREQKLLLDNLTRSYTGSRYPETWQQPPEDITAEEADQFMALTKEFLTWLKQRF